MEKMKHNILIACATLMFIFNFPVMAQQLPASNMDISPLLIGEQVPDVMVTGTDGIEHSLVALTTDKPTLIIFYRGKWCSNCTRHFSKEIAPHTAEIAKLGYNVINISPDVPDTLIQTAQLVNMDPANFYSDGEGELSKAVGVAVQQSERMLHLLETYSGGKNKGYLPVPSVFILNTDQKIIFEYINPMGPSDQFRIRGKFLMTVLEALK